MPQYRAVKTFGTEKSKYGLVRSGQVLTMPVGDAAKFNRANPGVLVEHVGPNFDAAPPLPADESALFPHAHAHESAPLNAAHDAPPHTREDDDDAGKALAESDGTGALFSALRRGRRSKKKTSKR